MILLPAKPGDPPCVICGSKSDLEVVMNLRRTQFCNACRRTLAAAFRLGERATIVAGHLSSSEREALAEAIQSAPDGKILSIPDSGI